MTAVIFVFTRDYAHELNNSSLHFTNILVKSVGPILINNVFYNSPMTCLLVCLSITKKTGIFGEMRTNLIKI